MPVPLETTCKIQAIDYKGLARIRLSDNYPSEGAWDRGRQTKIRFRVSVADILNQTA